MLPVNTPRIEIVVGDIADSQRHQVEAYVVAANNELWMGAGVAGALKRAAGDDVEREAIALGPVQVGEAVLTSSGEMNPPARALIHAAAMGFTDRTQIYASEQSVYRATLRSLQICDDHQLKSIVFPALGTGVGGLNEETCARAMSEAINAHVKAGTSIERIRIVVTTGERQVLFQQHIILAN